MENNNKIFPILSNLINKYLDKEIKLTRVKLAEYLNNTLQSNSDKITDIDIHIDEIVKSYYEMYASTDQKKFIEKSFIKSKFDTERIIDPYAINIKPLTLDIYNIDQQSKILDIYAEELLQNTKKLAIEEYNNIVHLAENKIANFIENEVFFSLSGKKRVEAAADHAKNVYETYANIINSHLDIKHTIRQFFNDFSELRNNLRFIREDFYYIIQLYIGADLTEEELKLLSFDEIKWLEYDKIQDRLDLKYNEIQEKCSTFYSINNQAINEIVTTASIGINKILDKQFSENYKYSRSEFKNDLYTTGFETAISTLINLSETNDQANITVAELRKETELLKQFFFEDKIALQQDLFRLIKLYNTIKNIFIPVTHEFKNLLVNVIKNEYIHLISDDQIEKLFIERQELIQSKKELTITINENENISNELLEIAKYAKLERDEYKNYYDFVLSQEPQKSSLLVKVFTLGLCDSYYVYYRQLWENEFVLVEDQYNYLKNTYNEKQHIYSKNQEKLVGLKTILTNTNSNIIKTEKELKEYINKNKLEVSDILKSKIKELIKIAETSKLVLEQTIHEELKDPKKFTESINNLNDFIIQNKLKSNNQINFEGSNNELDAINQIITFVKSNSNFNKVTEQFIVNFTENLEFAGFENKDKLKEIYQEELKKGIIYLGDKFQLKNYDLETYRDQFMEHISSKLTYKGEQIVKKDQLLKIRNIAIQYFKTAAQVHTLNRESEILSKLNQENQKNLDENLRDICKKTRAEVDEKLKNINTLFNDLKNINSSEEKIDLFNQFLKQ